MEKKFDPTLILIIPILGIIGGGYLSLPITSMTKGREPWTSIALAGGLVATISIVGGLWMGSAQSAFLGASAVGVSAYLIMVFAGGFRQHIEPFFAAHMLAFMTLLVISSIQHKEQEAEQVGAGDAEKAV